MSCGERDAERERGGDREVERERESSSFHGDFMAKERDVEVSLTA